MIVPHGQGQDHSSLHSIAHGPEATLGRVIVGILENWFDSIAIGFSDGIVSIGTVTWYVDLLKLRQ